MSKSKILVVLGHPDADSLSGHLASEYVTSAESAGKQVRYIKLGELDFDPVLRHGYKQRQEHEPGLVHFWESIVWADHLAFFYPTWWGAMPALLKGALDRVLLPGRAFSYRENSQFWDRLLTGRSAHVFTTMDTPPWYYRFAYRMPGHNQMKRTVLGFCGVKPVKIHAFGPVRYATPKKKEKWESIVRRAAAAG
ncbi:MAG: NAD(P)H-dependent oxidoreductase [Pseudomonadota bacterium]